ncbi:MAG: 1-acyl-sn-glycerol-3-phosphate acyltransferase [Bradymonadia bacterium]|jgi:1-acyl-sn-glycerol-3-phosphate acyltransferase
MSLIYRVLRTSLRAAIDLYFVEVHATGLENIPDEGPVLFAANHPNSLMDAVLLSMKTKRQVCFLGRSGLFSNPVSNYLLNSVGVIPVYRRGDDPKDMGKNQDTFRRAYEVLRDGRTIGIFPEGHNSKEHHVGEFKTGVGRIALGAEESADWQLGLVVVPAGLSYENRDAFMSAALIRFAPAIPVQQYQDKHAADPRVAVTELTERVGHAIRTQALHITDDRLKDLTSQLWDIAGARLLSRYLADDVVSIRPRWRGLVDQMRSTVEARPEIDGLFEAKRELADALERIRVEHPRDWMLLRNASQRHIDHINQLQLRDEVFQRDPSTTRASMERIKRTAYALAFGPLAGWGFVTNVIPYQAIKQISLLRKDEAMRAITGAGVGVTLGPGLYALQGYLLWRITDSIWFTVLASLSMIPSGFFFLRYRSQLAKYRDRIFARVLFRTRRGAVEQVFSERSALVERLESLLNQSETEALIATSSELPVE